MQHFHIRKLASAIVALPAALALIGLPTLTASADNPIIIPEDPNNVGPGKQGYTEIIPGNPGNPGGSQPGSGGSQPAPGGGAPQSGSGGGGESGPADPCSLFPSPITVYGCGGPGMLPILGVMPFGLNLPQPGANDQLTGGASSVINQPTPGELAQEVYKILKAPTFTLEFSPSDPATYVGTDTYFWYARTSPGTLTAELLTVEVTATFNRFEIDPGDGSGTFTCAEETKGRSENCVHTYEKTSKDGATTVDGLPAYEATARLVYDVAFTVNGAPLNIDGLPTTLMREQTTAVPVGEIQTIVTQ